MAAVVALQGEGFLALIQPQQTQLSLLEVENSGGEMLKVVEHLAGLQADAAQLRVQLLLQVLREGRQWAPAFKEPSRRGIHHPSKVWML